MTIGLNGLNPETTPVTDATKQAAVKEIEKYIKAGSRGSHPYECLHSFTEELGSTRGRDINMGDFNYMGDFANTAGFINELITYFLNSDNLIAFESRTPYVCKGQVAEYLPAIRTLFDSLGYETSEAEMTKYYLEHYTNGMTECQANKVLLYYKAKNGNS